MSNDADEGNVRVVQPRPKWMTTLDELEEFLVQATEALRKEFPNCKPLSKAVTARGVNCHFEPSEKFPNTGTFMLMLKYLPESECVNIECTMELNHQTVRDLEDCLRVRLRGAAVEGEELAQFVSAKVDQFRTLYLEPQDLGPEEVPEETESCGRATKRPKRQAPRHRKKNA